MINVALIILTLALVLALVSKEIKHNAWQLVVAVDQLLNVAICSVIMPNSKSFADETFSCRCYRKATPGRWGWIAMRKLVDLIFRPFEKDHCRLAYENEEARGHSPAELQKGVTGG